jgi:hypothetical protein
VASSLWTWACGADLPVRSYPKPSPPRYRKSLLRSGVYSPMLQSRRHISEELPPDPDFAVGAASINPKPPRTRGQRTFLHAPPVSASRFTGLKMKARNREDRAPAQFWLRHVAESVQVVGGNRIGSTYQYHHPMASLLSPASEIEPDNSLDQDSVEPIPLRFFPFNRQQHRQNIPVPPTHTISLLLYFPNLPHGLQITHKERDT